MPSDIDASHLDVINYAFAVIYTQFNVVNYEWDDFDFYAQLQAKKQTNPKLQTFISIGGWNFNLFDSTKYFFSNMASTSSNRAHFIQSAIAFAHTHGFDGIDIDWEYPGWADQGGNPSDTPNFNSFVLPSLLSID